MGYMRPDPNRRRGRRAENSRPPLEERRIPHGEAVPSLAGGEGAIEKAWAFQARRASPEPAGTEGVKKCFRRRSALPQDADHGGPDTPGNCGQSVLEAEEQRGDDGRVRKIHC